MTFTKQQILAAEEQLYKSIKACDVKSLDDVLHEDLLFNNHFGQTITKQIDLEIYKSGNLVVSELIPGECQINLIGDTAIVTVVIALKGEYTKQPFEGKYHYLRVWKNFDGVLKVIAGSSVEMQ